jgi:YVTN family beta-propeller protein
MKTKQLVVSALAVSLAFVSCKKNDPAPTPETPTTSTYDNGVFVTNEGPYGTGTGTISFYSRGSASVSNDIFAAKNSYPLGNVVQSMEVFNGKGYIIVNNAGKIEVVDANTFVSSGSITGLNSPRFFLGLETNKAYVSEWGTNGTNGAVKVVDLSTKTVTATITTGKGAEQMVKVGTSVYVACSGGFDNDSIVSVINTSTNAVSATINVGANPKSIKIDASGKIWILCAGQFDMTYTTLIKPAKLVRIDPSTNTVDLTFTFSSTYSQPFCLVTNAAKTMLYYTYDSKVYSQSTSATTLNTAPVINRNFYSLGVDPTNDDVYCANAGNFSSAGNVIRYTNSGTLIDSFAVGIIPGNFCFK